MTREMHPPSEYDRLPPKPIRPADEDCCGNDCPLCVFTLYDRELERWQAQLEAIKAQRDER